MQDIYPTVCFCSARSEFEDHRDQCVRLAETDIEFSPLYILTSCSPSGDMNTFEELASASLVSPDE